MEVGLTLSGGGLRGVAHIGVLKALFEMGIVPNILTGTSIGSVMVALYASGMNLYEIIDIAYSLDNSILDPDYLGILKSVFNLKIPDGLIKGNKIEKLIDKSLEGININHIKDKKIAIVATNVNGGENIVFSNQKIQGYNCINDITLSKAVRSSIGLPLVFKPVRIDDMVLIDGGIVNNCPINLAEKMGADFIIASDIAYNGAKLADSYDGSKIISNTIGIALKEAYLNDMDEVHVNKVIIRFDDLRNIPVLDFSKENFDLAMKIGYERTKETMKNYMTR